MKQAVALQMMSPEEMTSKIQINISELYHEKLCEKNVLILVWPEWLGLRDRTFWNSTCCRF